MIPRKSKRATRSSWIRFLLKTLLLPIPWVQAAVDGDAPTPPSILAVRVEPAIHTPFIGGSAALLVEASGTPPLSYQWVVGDMPIEAATNAVLRFARLHADDAGQYRVRVGNPVGTVVSSTTALRPATWVIWGNEIIQKNGVPPSATNLVAVSAWESQTIGLRSDGTVVVWSNAGGLDAPGLMPPAGLRGVVAVRAGPGYNLALLGDGRLRAWGWNASALAIPAETRDVIAIAAGHQFCLALRSDGTVLVLGDNPEARRHAFGIRDGVGVTAYIGWGTVRRSNGTSLNLGLTPYLTYEPPTLTPPFEGASIAATSADYGHGIALLDEGPPRIVQQPRGVEGMVGGNARLQVVGFGGPPLRYQWRVDGYPILGANESLLALDNLSVFDAGVYDVVVSNGRGSVISEGARISVTTRAPFDPRIALTPFTGAGTLGGRATLTATAEGTPPFAYRWVRNGELIVGERNAILELRDLGMSDAGTYAVTIANAYGVVESSPVNLAVVSVVAWGGNHYGQTEVPLSATNVVAISAGMQHGVALRNDGTVVVWGNLPKDGGMLDGGALKPPPGLSNVVSVAAGSGQNVALRVDGTLVGWGENSFGRQNGLAGWSNVVAVSAGHTHTLALRADGTVLRAGWNNDGQLDLPRDIDDYIAVAAGYEFSVAVRRDGTVLQAGRSAPRPPADATNVVAISAGQYHVLAMRADGSLVGWGAGGLSESLSGVTAFHAGGSHSLAILDDGRVMAWGDSWLGQTEVPLQGRPAIGVGAGFAHSIALIGSGPPRLLQQPIDFTATVGRNVRLAVSASGTLPMRYQWRRAGANIPNAIGPVLALDAVSIFDADGYDVVVSNAHGATTSRLATLDLRWQAPSRVTAFVDPTNGIAFLGGTARFAAISDGSPPLGFQWRSEGNPVLGVRGREFAFDRLTFADSGDYRVAAANPQGGVTSAPVRLSVLNLAVWGGRNGGSDSRVFSPPEVLTNVVAVAPSQWHGLALRADGTTVAWGDPLGGKLSVPESATNLVALAAGGEFSLGLRRDGTVLAWGDAVNAYGIRGVATRLTNVVQIAAAYSWALALEADGTVVQWGTYIGGWMTPPPPGLSNVVQISAGERHALALLENGWVVGWGDNSLGTAMPPAGLGRVASVVAGDSYNMALRDDGTVVEWGRDAMVPPPEATDLVAIATGKHHRVGLRADGSVVSWGWENGGLGQTRVPPDLPPVIAVAAAGDASFAVIPVSGEPHIARHPRSRRIYSGELLRIEASVFPGADDPTFQWLKNGRPVPGATNRVLEFIPAAASDSGRYALQGRNEAGTGTSREAEVVVLDSGPLLVREPRENLSYAGGAATFDVEVAGSLPMSFQWYRDGIPLPSLTNRSMTLVPVLATDGGLYHVEVRNPVGTVISGPARLRIVPALSLAQSEIPVSPAGRFTVKVRATEPAAVPVMVRFIYGGDFGPQPPFDSLAEEPREAFVVLEPGASEQATTFEDPTLYSTLIGEFPASAFLRLVEADLPIDPAASMARLVPLDPGQGPPDGTPPSEPPRFDRGSIRMRPDGGVEFVFTRTPGIPFRVEASSDLQTWMEIQGKPAFDVSGRQVWFIEPAAGYSAARFYRVLSGQWHIEAVR